MIVSTSTACDVTAGCGPHIQGGGMVGGLVSGELLPSLAGAQVTPQAASVVMLEYQHGISLQCHSHHHFNRRLITQAVQGSVAHMWV